MSAYPHQGTRATATITPADAEAFDRDGYVIKRGLFNEAEVDLLQRALATDEALRANAFGLDDGYGGQTTVAVWNHPGDDTLGIVPRLQRVGGAVATLLGGEVYHYHSKVTSKPPGGGTWDWHQDYGYWYKNGVLFPNLATVAIAISELTEANGTMRLLRGSQLCGRLEHSIVGGQNGADVERVEVLREHLEEVSFVAEPGDACFFHCNTLHTSAPNMSGHSRDLLLCSYNRADNNPTREHHHPFYTPLALVEDGALLRTGLWTVGRGRSFMDPADDISIGEFEPDPQR